MGKDKFNGGVTFTYSGPLAMPVVRSRPLAVIRDKKPYGTNKSIIDIKFGDRRIAGVIDDRSIIVVPSKPSGGAFQIGSDDPELLVNQGNDLINTAPGDNVIWGVKQPGALSPDGDIIASASRLLMRYEGRQSGQNYAGIEKDWTGWRYGEASYVETAGGLEITFVDRPTEDEIMFLGINPSDDLFPIQQTITVQW